MIQMGYGVFDDLAGSLRNSASLQLVISHRGHNVSLHISRVKIAEV
jgi:hypothetical protein